VLSQCERVSNESPATVRLHDLPSAESDDFPGQGDAVGGRSSGRSDYHSRDRSSALCAVGNGGVQRERTRCEVHVPDFAARPLRPPQRMSRYVPPRAQEPQRSLAARSLRHEPNYRSTSVLPQRHHRSDTRRAAGRHEGGCQRARREHHHPDADRHGVCRADAVQLTPKQAY
jgi:hypothetical protein